MTDHLDEAATKAVELAEELGGGPRDDLLNIQAAQHLTYLAGLIRGAAVRQGEEPYEFVDGPPPEGRWETRVRTFPVSPKTAEDEVDGLVPRRQLNRARSQRDDLLAAAKDVLACGNLENRACLREAVERIEDPPAPAKH